MHLLAAELGLARSAISWIFVAGLAATVAGVGLGLSLLAFTGLLLAKWFGSWFWALLAPPAPESRLKNCCPVLSDEAMIEATLLL